MNRHSRGKSQVGIQTPESQSQWGTVLAHKSFKSKARPSVEFIEEEKAVVGNVSLGGGHLQHCPGKYWEHMSNGRI